MSAWILLRGLARESRHWAQLPERLRACGVQSEVVGVDLPGSGRYVQARAPANIPETTAFLRARLAEQGYEPPYCVVALSLGGMVGVDWAQRFPDEIERLVLINTSMGRHGRLSERMRPSAWPLIARAAWRWRDRRAAEGVIHALTCARTDSLEPDLNAWIGIYRSAPPTRANVLRQLLAAARFDGPIDAPRCPTLVLASRGDALVHPTCSAKLAAAWGATLIEHPWAGHDLAHDDPAWLADTIAGWVGNALTVKALPTSA